MAHAPRMLLGFGINGLMTHSTSSPSSSSSASSSQFWPGIVVGASEQDERVKSSNTTPASVSDLASAPGTTSSPRSRRRRMLAVC